MTVAELTQVAEADPGAAAWTEVQRLRKKEYLAAPTLNATSATYTIQPSGAGPSRPAMSW